MKMQTQIAVGGPAWRLRGVFCGAQAPPKQMPTVVDCRHVVELQRVWGPAFVQMATGDLGSIVIIFCQYCTFTGCIMSRNSL